MSDSDPAVPAGPERLTGSARLRLAAAVLALAAGAAAVVIAILLVRTALT